MSADVGEPARDPRPQDDDGTYRCYHEDCDRPADLVTPRRIESTRIDPVETAVTTCLRCYLAMEVLGDTRGPLSSTVEVHERVQDEMTADDADGPAAATDVGGEWAPLRLHARLLANCVLHDDSRGRDPPGEDSPLGDIFEHAGERAERLRERLETSIEEQLYASGYPDTPERPRGEQSADLGAFGGAETATDQEQEQE